MQIDWNTIQSNWDWAGHLLEAAVMAAIVALLLRPLVRWQQSFIIGLSFAAGHFHGREKRDYEVAVQMPPPHLEAYYFWQWSWDQATDFWPTAAACLLAILMVTRNRQP
ncbi:hypothetical protein [Rhizobium halophilum]|uniref:hypothetical protein n=1 Tax=Rhizobium halophilum TaxID=2846852 RepID=UPI001EFD843C|nr:hypothetical protein [Rhizobium halophilum]MCF6369486.1 hypothetical protein [Rhizobium halophilum]